MWLGSRFRHLLWVGLGILMGVPLALLVMGVPIQSPLHATATDRFDTFAVCTGSVDENVEAIYFLDFLTGNLRAGVVSPAAQPNPALLQPGQAVNFAAYFDRDVLADMGVDSSKNPRFLLVSGRAQMRGTSGVGGRPSSSLVYVAEITSGQVIAYAIPWNQGMTAGGYKSAVGKLMPIARTMFRRPDAVRQAPGAAPK